MSFLDKAKDALEQTRERAEDLAAEHGDKADGAIDKAAELIAAKAPAAIAGKADVAAQKAKDLVDDLEAEGKKKQA